jgi:putative FmdB family regulatory protein
MPTYQYACTSPSCGLEFERVQAFTDPAITDCPDCTSRVRKVYGSVGVVFKGSGFYRTDSRNGKSGESKSGESKSGDGKSSESTTSSSDSAGKTASADSAKSAKAGTSGSSDAKPVAAAAS